MCTNRTNFWCFFTNYKMSTVNTLPHHITIFRENKRFSFASSLFFYIARIVSKYITQLSIKITNSLKKKSQIPIELIKKHILSVLLILKVLESFLLHSEENFQCKQRTKMHLANYRNLTTSTYCYE